MMVSRLVIKLEAEGFYVHGSHSIVRRLRQGAVHRTVVQADGTMPSPSCASIFAKRCMKMASSGTQSVWAAFFKISAMCIPAASICNTSATFCTRARRCTWVHGCLAYARGKPLPRRLPLFATSLLVADFSGLLGAKLLLGRCRTNRLTREVIDS